MKTKVITERSFAKGETLDESELGILAELEGASWYEYENNDEATVIITEDISFTLTVYRLG